jgi:ABC-type iron transport system FetAB ATPase subunit
MHLHINMYIYRYEKIDLTSTHGFDVDHEIDLKNDKLRNGVDDEDEIIFNVLDSKDRNNDGKVTYSILPNTPTGHMDLERPLERSPFFKVEGINVLSGDKNLFGVDGLTMLLIRGERLSVEGPSGLGKTRLLRAIAQLDSPIGGSMSFLDDLSSPKELRIPLWRRKVLYVPQAVPPLAGSPADILSEACLYTVRKGRKNVEGIIADIDKRCTLMEQSLGLSAGKLSSSWGSLSGGERQRAAIGVALLLACTVTEEITLPPNSNDGDDNFNRAISNFNRPSALLLLDEPTAACDSNARYVNILVFRPARVMIMHFVFISF